MKQLFDSVVEKTIFAKNKVNEIISTKQVDFPQVVDWIIDHPNCTSSQFNALDLTFTTFNLSSKGFHFRLEMMLDKVLDLKIYNMHTVTYHYQSYKDHKKGKIPLPAKLDM
jgi:hypothetical protein